MLTKKYFIAIIELLSFGWQQNLIGVPTVYAMCYAESRTPIVFNNVGTSTVNYKKFYLQSIYKERWGCSLHSRFHTMHSIDL